MEKFLLLKPVLSMISGGKFFAKVFYWLLRLVACLILIGLLFGTFKLWYPLTYGFEIKIVIVNIFLQILLIAFVYAAINILWFRSADINALPRSIDYPVIPACVIFIKTIGELLAVVYILGGLAGGIGIWIIGNNPMGIPGLMVLATGSGIASGLAVIVVGMIFGFLLLSLCYFIAEQVSVFVDIARNTRR